MRWFRKIVWRITKRAWEDNDEFAHEENEGTPNGLRRRRVHNILSSNSVVENRENLASQGMRFHLYTAVGGHILETHVYNSRDDNHTHTLYMIKEEEDFAKQVAQAIMLESMKH